MLKSYKYKLLPNNIQEEQIQKTFGCCRFVYNQTLNYRRNLYKTEKKSLSKYDCYNYMVRTLKIDFPWLKEIDKFALSNSVFNMDVAYQRFFKQHFGYPKFKSKKNSKKTYTTTMTNNNIEVSFESGRIKLPKLKWVKVVLHREFSGQIKSATVSQNSSGKYFVSILVETEHKPMNLSDHAVGIDLGIKDLIITSDGDKFANPHILKKYEKKLLKERRKLSRKTKGSKNYEKQKIKVATVYEKIRNTRIDNLHKISYKLINENQVIVSEDLSVNNMVKDKRFAKAISDCGWGELTRQLGYKAEWNGRKYIKIDRYVPSSQTCNACGYVNKETKDLSIREWTCPNCNTHHDRDVNAATNILKEGLREIDKNLFLC